jgi:UDP-N-acetylmuramoyl-L-alanyl-D-glutamate--2,6-diaminopimelate ligase
MAAAVEELADVALVTSDNPRHEKPEAIIEEILSGFKVFAPHSSGLGESIETPNLLRTPKSLTPALSQGEREKSGEIIVEVDRREAIGRALSEARAGDTVLIAGKGHENYQLVADRVLDFDDVEVARGFLDSMTHGEHPATGAGDDAGLAASSACGREVCA